MNTRTSSVLSSHYRNRIRACWLVSVSILVSLVSAATGFCSCNTPVFRYARENWAPTPFPLQIFHQGPLPSSQREWIESINKTGVPVNLQPRVIDVSQPLSPPDEFSWKQVQATAPTPWMVLRHPADEGVGAEIWSGKLDAQATRQLVSSPFREKLVGMLQGEFSVVWVLIPSSDSRQAMADERRILALLGSLEKEIVLSGDDTPAEPANLHPRFGLLTLSRDDEQEAITRKIFMESEPLESSSGSLLFPVFGQGRVLPALHGSTLTEAQISRWATFLCNGCSCQIKELNPGFDLLLAADWPKPALSAQPSNTSANPSPAIPPGIVQPSAPVEMRSLSLRSYLMSVAIIGLGMLAVMGWILSRRRSEIESKP